MRPDNAWLSTKIKGYRHSERGLTPVLFRRSL